MFIAARRGIVCVKWLSFCTQEELTNFILSWSIEQDKCMPILGYWVSMTSKDRANVGISGIVQVSRCRHGT